MILKSFIVAVLSIIIFFLLFTGFQYLIYKEETEPGEFIMALVFLGGAMLSVIFILLCLLNFLIQWRLKSTGKSKANSVYFFLELPFYIIANIIICDI